MFWNSKKEDQTQKAMELLLAHIGELHSQNIAMMEFVVSGPQREAEIDAQRSSELREMIIPLVQDGSITKLVDRFFSATNDGRVEALEEQLEAIAEENEELRGENAKLLSEIEKLKSSTFSVPPTTD